jgi:hypothetical protein
MNELIIDNERLNIGHFDKLENAIYLLDNEFAIKSENPPEGFEELNVYADKMQGNSYVKNTILNSIEDAYNSVKNNTMNFVNHIEDNIKHSIIIVIAIVIIV